MDTDVQQMVLVKEEAPEEQSAVVDEQDHLHIKEEQKELWTSLEGEHLDAARFPLTSVTIKSEDDEEKPLLSQLHQQQIQDGDVPTSSSADHMTTESSRNLDLNPHEQTSDSSATEVSGDDVNLDSETGGDNDWNENRSSESDVETVNKSFSCSECGKQFLHKWTLQKHVRATSHSAIRSVGYLINKKCVREKQNVDSCRKVQKELKSFSCVECGKRFSVKSNLNRHMRVHTRQTLFACDLCGKSFCQKGYLKCHMRVHTGQKPYSCETCGQRFGHNTTLNNHIRVHTGQKPFACEICGQKFSRKAILNNHIRVHTGQKPFACEICAQRFRHKVTLNNHTRVHTGQKPFACEICDQRFSHKTTLNNHIRVHTGEKPFSCEICGQIFSQKTHLNVHIRVHKGQKPFPCELCGQRFSLKATLNRHMRVHTGHKKLFTTKVPKMVYVDCTS